MPKAATVAFASSSSASRSNSSASFGLRAGESGLDEVDAERVEGADDVQLLADRERHPLAAHAVTQSRVVELHLFHLLPFESEFREEATGACLRGTKPRQPLGGWR